MISIEVHKCLICNTINQRNVNKGVEDIEKKVHLLEKEHLPKVIGQLLSDAGLTEYERYCREQALQQEEEFDDGRCFPDMPEGQFVRGH